jgi:hypothetical protein
VKHFVNVDHRLYFATYAQSVALHGTIAGEYGKAPIDQRTKTMAGKWTCKKGVSKDEASFRRNQKPFHPRTHCGREGNDK